MHYHVRHLKRLPLGTSYLKFVARVRVLLDYVRGAELVVDATGVGRPVIDMFREEGLQRCRCLSRPATGRTTSADSGACQNATLSARCRCSGRRGRLRIAEGLPDAQTLVDELLRFRVRIDPRTAHDSYGAWREGAHDDLVLALAVACWRAERQPRYSMQEWGGAMKR